MKYFIIFSEVANHCEIHLRPNISNNSIELTDDDTCSLRKTLLLGIPLLFLYPLLILAMNIADKKQDDEFNLNIFISLSVLGFFSSFFPMILFYGDIITNFTLNIWSFLVTWYILGPLFTRMIIALIFLLFMGLYKLYSYSIFASNNKSNISSELYNSAKDKYCKKINIKN